MEYRGLHADPKPANAKEGDVFKELDTDSVYKFEGGKWTFSPGGAGGEGLSDGIDIIGTDKELKDLSGIAVGFDLPDIPEKPDITVSRSISQEGRVFDKIKISDTMIFDIGDMDLDDLSTYENEQTILLEKPIKVSMTKTISGDIDRQEEGRYISADAHLGYDKANSLYYPELIFYSSDDIVSSLYYYPVAWLDNEKGLYYEYAR